MEDDNACKQEWLKLLSDSLAALEAARDSLSDGVVEGVGLYLASMAEHVWHAVEGYTYLRTNGRIDASKLLVRPVIECIMRMLAVESAPDLLFTLAYTEWQDDKKWMRGVSNGDIAVELATLDVKWDEFKREYQAKFPLQSLVEKKLSAFSIAERAGAAGYYNSHYRLYSRFTHAAFRATRKSLDEFEKEDSPTVALCTLTATGVLVRMGANVPNLSELDRRRERLIAARTGAINGA